MFTDTITLFNRYHSNTLGDIWYPHVIHNVQLIKDKASIVAKYGSESKDSASLIINTNVVSGNTYINGMRYLPPKEWAVQVNDALPALITLNDNADLFDFFIEGLYLDEDGNEITTPIDDDAYRSGFYNEMNKRYDYCYAITSVGSGYSLIPHFEVMAR